MKGKLGLKSGFTIVELLIVIIVIGILASIVIVAYNGVQTRAKNAKTAAAVADWAKAFKLYHTKEGELPIGSSCLGNSDTYPSNECEPGEEFDSASYSMFEPYLGDGPLPEPDVTKIINPDDSADYRSGAIYWSPDGQAGAIYYVQINTDSCPDIGGLSSSEINLDWDGGIQCVGYLED